MNVSFRYGSGPNGVIQSFGPDFLTVIIDLSPDEKRALSQGEFPELKSLDADDLIRPELRPAIHGMRTSREPRNCQARELLNRSFVLKRRHGHDLHEKEAAIRKELKALETKLRGAS